MAAPTNPRSHSHPLQNKNIISGKPENRQECGKHVTFSEIEMEEQTVNPHVPLVQCMIRKIFKFGGFENLF